MDGVFECDPSKIATSPCGSTRFGFFVFDDLLPCTLFSTKFNIGWCKCLILFLLPFSWRVINSNMVVFLIALIFSLKI